MKSVSLGKYYDEFVEAKVKSGRYATVSEVIRDGLRQLENQERGEMERMAVLRAEIQKGFDDPAYVDGEAGFQKLDKIISGYEGK